MMNKIKRDLSHFCDKLAGKGEYSMKKMKKDISLMLVMAIILSWSLNNNIGYAEEIILTETEKMSNANYSEKIDDFEYFKIENIEIMGDEEAKKEGNVWLETEDESETETESETEIETEFLETEIVDFEIEPSGNEEAISGTETEAFETEAKAFETETEVFETETEVFGTETEVFETETEVFETEAEVFETETEVFETETEAFETETEAFETETEAFETETEAFETETEVFETETEAFETETEVFETEVVILDMQKERVAEGRSVSIASGTCGKQAKWEIDSAGTLTISGSGEMDDYNIINSDRTLTRGTRAPWRNSYNGIIKKIVVEEGITSIGNGAFMCVGAEFSAPFHLAKGAVESVSLPSTLKRIGNKAFYNVYSDKIMIPEGVTEIEENALTGAEFKNVTISIARIPKASFYQSRIQSVTFTDNVKIIGEKAFSDCTQLTNIFWSKNIETIENEAFRGCNSLVSVKLPDSLISIGEYAFDSCKGLTDVDLPQSLKTMERGIFSRCTSLKKIEVPKSVTKMGGDMFHFCSSLEYAEINASVTSVGSYIFACCSSLKTVILPETLGAIGAAAFGGCTELKEIKIPDGVTDIYTEAFNECTSLTSITIPASVNNIVLGRGGKGSIYTAFDRCTNLVSINVDKNNKVYTTYDGCLYTKDMTELLYCPLGKTEVIISENTRQIPDYAFFTREEYEGVKRINEKLKSIYFRGDAPAIGTQGFMCISADAYYPVDNKTWTNENKIAYEGNVNWKGWQYDISKYTLTISSDTYIYDGTEKRPTVSLKIGSLELPADNYKVSYQNNRNAGTASVILSGVGKYEGKLSGKFQIQKADVGNFSMRLSKTSYVYNGTNIKPVVTVTGGNKVLKSGTDYTVSYLNNKNAGDSLAMIVGKGNYKGTLIKTFTIKPADISKYQAGISASSMEYNGAYRKPTVTVKNGETVLKKDRDYAVMYTNNKNLGTATIKIVGDGNYKGIITKQFKIRLVKGHTYTVGNIGYRVINPSITGSGTVAVKTIKNKNISTIVINDFVNIGGKKMKIIEIDASAFSYCKKLKAVTIGKPMQSIGTGAFKGCKMLKNIKILGSNIKKVGANAFKDINEKAIVKVPASKIKSYKILLKNAGLSEKAIIEKL